MLPRLLNKSTVFSTNFEVVSQNCKVANRCMASAQRARTTRGGSGGMPPWKIFNKQVPGDAIRGIWGTLWQEKLCNFSDSFCVYLESIVITRYLSPNTNTIFTY